MTSAGIKVKSAKSVVRSAVSKVINRDYEILMTARRKEASRMASMLNKRVARLEKNNLEDSPAYQQHIKDKPKFSVRGKSNQEIAAEMERMKKFMKSSTSTIKGTKAYLMNVAATIGLPNAKPAELMKKIKSFFKLANEIETYLDLVENSAAAIGYHQVWETIHEYVQDKKLDLVDLDSKLINMQEIVGRMVQNEREKVQARQKLNFGGLDF